MAVKKEPETPGTFTKEQILSSKRYRDKRDAINVILDEKKSYSLAEVDKLFEKFMKDEVN